MKKYSRVIMTLALLLTISMGAWAADVKTGTVSNVTISFSASENGAYSATLTDASGTVYMKVAPTSGYYIRKSDITLHKSVGSGSAQAPSHRTAPVYDGVVTLEGTDPTDLAAERIYHFTMPDNGADVTVDATAVSYGGLTYQYDTTTKTLTISKGSGDGTMSDFTTENPAPWAGLVDAETTVVIEPGVSNIGDNAFTGTTPATIFVPSATTVPTSGALNTDAEVFKYTKDASDNVTITDYQGTATSLEVPASVGDNPVTTIGDNAFKDNTAIEEVTIPSSVTSVSATALSGCTSLTDVFVETSDHAVAVVAAVDDQVDNTFTFSTDANDQVTITGYAGSTSGVVEIPATVGGKEVTTISSGDANNPVFSDSQTIVVPDGVTTTTAALGDNASQLTYTKSGDDVTITGFSGSADVVEIPTTVGGGTVTTISNGAFTGTDAPATVLVPESVTTSTGAFDNTKTDQLTYKENTSGETTTIEITDYVGNGGTVEIPAEIGGNAVTKISADDFKGDNAPTVIVPQTAATNSAEAFDTNSNVLTYTETTNSGTGEKEVTITGFSGNADVVEIPAEIGGTTVTAIGGNAFSGTNDSPSTVLVPDAAKGNVDDSAFDDTKTDQLTYKEESNGEVTITGYTGSTSGVVEIPAEIGGKEVTKIDNGDPNTPVFTGNQTVIVPDGAATAGAFGENTSQLTYDKDDTTGNVTITGFSGSADVVEIPATVGGGTVTTVTGEGFKGNDAPTVIVPQAVAENDASTGLDNTSSVLTYTETTNTDTGEKEVTITGFSGSADVVEIPATVGGGTVTTVTGNDFKGENAPTVIVPQTVADNSTSALDNTSNVLTYTETTNTDTGEKEVTITGYKGDDKVVEIPATVGGNTVTTVTGDDFKGENAPTVIVPQAVADNENSTGLDENSSSYLTYTEDATTGDVTITGYKGDDKVVEIPTTVGGNTVTTVTGNDFKGENAPTVIVPQAVADNENSTGLDDNSSSYLTYTEDATTGDVTITGYKGDADRVDIPTTIDGNDVTGIGAGAFTGDNDSPKTILVPEGATVEDGAIDKNETDEFTYTETDNGSGGTDVTITGYQGNSDVVEVPSSVGGNDVTTVASGTFTGGNDAPATVLIPQTNDSGNDITSTGATGDDTAKLTYTETDNGSGGTDVTITGYEGNGGTVVIPPTVGGNDVTGISDNVFNNDDENSATPSTVVVPNTVTGSEGAFDSNTTGQLTYEENKDNEGNPTGEVTITGYTGGGDNANVEIPAEIGGGTVTGIDDNAFAGATNVENITVPETVPTDVSNGVGGNTNVAVTRSMGVLYLESNRQWATYYATEDLALPTELKAYVVTSYDIAASSVTTEEISYIPKNQGVLLSTTGDKTSIEFKASVKKEVSADEHTQNDAKIANNKLAGGESGTVPAGAYILYENNFVLTGGGPLKANRCYLPAPSGAAPAYFVIDNGDNATSLSEKLSVDGEESAEAQWYTLDGRRLTGKPSQKGLYIVNGKVMVVK